MGKRRGPAPEPAARKTATGNPGRRPILAGEIEEPAIDDDNQIENVISVVECPAWLNADGRMIWDRLAGRLATMKILEMIDAETFGRYCMDFGRWIKLQRVLDAEGETYESESPHGTYIRSHPAFIQASRLNRELMMAEANFALNPADRQRLFAARAAAGAGAGLGAGGADLFDQSNGDRGGKISENNSKPKTPIGVLLN